MGRIADRMQNGRYGRSYPLMCIAWRSGPRLVSGEEKWLIRVALQKKGNSKSGSEMAKDKDMVAAKMREKQALADAKKVAEAAAKK